MSSLLDVFHFHTDFLDVSESALDNPASSDFTLASLYENVPYLDVCLVCNYVATSQSSGSLSFFIL